MDISKFIEFKFDHHEIYYGSFLLGHLAAYEQYRVVMLLINLTMVHQNIYIKLIHILKER